MASRKAKESATGNDLNIIELDKKQILDEIAEKGKYVKEGVLIKKWDGDGENSENFITELEKDGSRFIGVLDGKLERHGYGIHYYKNGDKYFGFFEDDKPNKNGIYIWNPIYKGRNIQTECYYGLWKNNKKDKSGIYIWMNEPLNNKQFDDANFDTYIGIFKEDKFVRGTYLSKNVDDYYLYHGDFDSDGKKTDDNAYFYSSKFDRVLHGKIQKDNFISAYVAFFESDSGEIKNLVHCDFDKSGNVISIVLQNDLKREDKVREENDIILFRNVILEIDYFGIIYSKYHEIKDFIRDNMDSIDILEDKNKFPLAMSLCSKHGENNIFRDIEKKALRAKKREWD